MDSLANTPAGAFTTPDSTLLIAVRALMRSTSEEEIIGVLIDVVRALGASVVSEKAQRPSTLGIDLSLGIGSPMFVDVPDQVTHARIQNLIPPLIDDARLVIARMHAGERAGDDSTDPLTGLANWASAMRSLSRLLPGDAVAVLEIEHLEQINDYYGSEVGDDVLVTFARTVRQVARMADSVGRVGGKNFIWLLGSSGLLGAESALGRLRQTWVRDRPHPATYAAGLALVSGAGPMEAYMQADLARQDALQAGVGQTAISR